MAQYPSAMLRFHTPLIEPDRRFSRIRLSDKDSCVRTRKAASGSLKLNEPKVVVGIFEGKACRSPPWYLMLSTQPLAEPLTCVIVHDAVGSVDGSIREVIGPTCDHTIQVAHHFLRFHQAPTGVGLIADRLAEPYDLLLRWTRSNVGLPRTWRVTLPERVAQEVKRFVRDTTGVCLRLIDREFDPLHHVPHRLHCLLGVATTADHKVIGIVHDPSVKLPLVSQRLPAQNKTTHVHIR